MIAMCQGVLVSVKKNLPAQGSQAKPHLLLNVMQIAEDGAAELFSIKCDDLSIRFDGFVNKPLSFRCRLFPWHQGERAGLAIKYVSHEPVK